jgi:hypothetical protein
VPSVAKPNDTENLVKADVWTPLPLQRAIAPMLRSVVVKRLENFDGHTPKRLLQQYLHFSDLSGQADAVGTRG